MKKADNPFLRFPQYTGDLVPLSLEELSASVTSGSRDWAQFYASSGAKFIRMTNLLRGTPNLDLSDLKYVNVPKDSRDGLRTRLETDDVLVSITAELGKVGLVPSDLGEAYINQHIALIKPKNTIIGCFLANYLTAPQSQKRITRLNDSGAKAGLNLGTIKQFVVNLPDLREQQKIADFLTAVDTKINQITEKHRLLKEYKKGVMQQIFSQQLRFKDKDGKAFPEWEEKHFGEVFGRVTQKNSVNNLNVLTISAQKGLISQLEYFNKSVSAKDVSGYYLLRKGDFAYNKSYSQGYPMGAIKPLKFYDSGVVSTLYICFRPKKGFKEAYFEQFFDAGMLNREIAKIAQEGARNHGLLNVSVKEFFDDIKLLVPHQNEQQKIAQFLQALDSKIAAVSQQIEQTKQFKKGLLQQIFV
ncbi:TPA: restriction endonuclease subunit S [Vibrio cholerae]